MLLEVFVPSVGIQPEAATPRSVLQRLPTMAFEWRTYADGIQAAAVTGDLRRREGQVCGVQRPETLRDVISTSSLTASVQTDLTLSTHCGLEAGGIDRPQADRQSSAGQVQPRPRGHIRRTDLARPESAGATLIRQTLPQISC